MRVNKLDRFLLGPTARDPRASLRSAMSLTSVSNVVVVSILIGLASPAYSQNISTASASNKSGCSQSARPAHLDGEAAAVHKENLSKATSQPRTSTEAEQLRSEIGQLRAEIERLRSLVEAAVKKPSSGLSAS